MIWGFGEPEELEYLTRMWAESRLLGAGPCAVLPGGSPHYNSPIDKPPPLPAFSAPEASTLVSTNRLPFLFAPQIASIFDLLLSHVDTDIPDGLCAV